MTDIDSPAGAEPDTAIAEVTPTRVAEILRTEDLEHRLDSAAVGANETPLTVVRTGFVNSAVSYTVADDQLVMEALWRGTFEADRAVRLLAWINNWNQTQFAPTMRFFEQADGQLVASAIDLVPVAAGLSRNQLAVFVLSCLDNVTRAFRELEEDFPDLVTWMEDDHDHS